MEGIQERKGWAYYDRPDIAPEIVVTSRDVAVLWELYQNRFMTTQQMQMLFGVGVGRRIKRLFRAGLIDRPKQVGRVWRMREGGGSNSGLLALSDGGADVLAEKGLITRKERWRWSERNRALSPYSSKVPHEIGLNDVRIAFRRASAARPGLRIAPTTEKAHGLSARALDVPGHDELLYPDWLFFLVLEWAAESLFFVELHTGSEPQERFAQPDLSNLKGKYEGYTAYALTKRHLAQFGVNGFRVLTVITGGERMLENVVATAASVTGGQGDNRFLATRLDDLLAADPLELLWRNAAGEPVRLL
jgi:hypothetical protein